MTFIHVKVRNRLLRLMPWLTLVTFTLLAVALLPALFRSENSLQIRASRQGVSLPDGFYVYQSLNAQGIRIKSITPEQDALVIKFDSLEQSTAAEKVLHELLPYGFDIAHHQSSNATNWINRITLRTL